MFQQPFYPPPPPQQQQQQQQQQPPPPPPPSSSSQGFSNNRNSGSFFMPSHPFYYRSHATPHNQSTHNFNFTHDFERFSTPHHGFASMPTGGHPYFDYNNNNHNQNFEQHRWRHNISRAQHQHHQQQQQQQQQQHRRTPAFHFQDKSTSYYMTDPIITSDDRIAIQLTKVHIGPNGDQQRVFVEQEFSNEKELNKFVRNLRQNFEKTFNNRSPRVSSNTDESTSTNSKKSGVVVVEEPDEEPKIYQQQAYNANIESKKAAASVITPPSSPTMDSTPPPNANIRSPPAATTQSSSSTAEHHRKKPSSPPASHMSSTSTTRSHRHHHKNKMKYRRQPTDNTREDIKSSRIFPQMQSFSRQYQATPIPPRFQQQRFFHPASEFNIPSNPNFQWRHHQNSYPKNNRSRSYAPPMNDRYYPPPPPSTPPRFQHTMDPFFRPVNPPRFTHHRQKEFPPPPPSPSKFRRSNRRKMPQPTTIAENHIYPNHEQQQPRVHRTKSECQNFHKQQQKRSHSTTNHFQKFSPLKQTPIIQKHFIPFRSPPVILTSVHSTTPMFYPNQRRQFTNIQPQLRLINNHFRLGTNRF